jgi:hypothetical protein
MDDVASIENLFRAARKARLGKSRKPDVEEWWMRRETEIINIRHDLLSGAYQPDGYRFFEIIHPKRRLIAAAPFRDRVVHHALCNFLAPVLERRFIARSFSCQVGKGTTAARDCCRRLTSRYRYVLKCDVQKFFPSIDHAILLEKLTPYLACESVETLVEKLVSSFHSDHNIPSPLFAGDDLLSAAQRAKGVPIGNLTSQLWGNFFLDGMDHWITESQGHGAYLRYTDDFLLFGDDKRRLWELRKGIAEHLAGVRLRLAEPKSRLLSTEEGVPFCGFRFFPERRPRVLGATKRRFEAMRNTLVRSRDFRRLSILVFSWYQFSSEGNSEGLRKGYRRRAPG